MLQDLNQNHYPKKRSRIPNRVQACYIYSVNEVEHSKLLGIVWDSPANHSMFKFDELLDYANSLPLTKWSVLKITAKIFDPLGLLGPFIIRLKIMLRKLCVQKVDWDDLLQDELIRQWKLILAKFKRLRDIKIDRCYFKVSATPINVQLRGFCDASIEAYAVVLKLNGGSNIWRHWWRLLIYLLMAIRLQ